MLQIRNIIVHHTGGTDAQPLADSSNYTIQQCNADHKARFNMLSSLGWYVGYHYFIDKAGVITQTRVDTEEGAHTIGWNNHPGDPADRASIGICMAGNFDATLPTPAQVASLTKILTEKMKQYGIPAANIVPHRAHATKTCYGRKLADNWAASLVAGVVVTPPAPKLEVVSIGETGSAVKLVQDYLSKNGFQISTFTPGVFDEEMAKSVLYFQIVKNVADAKELSGLRGERAGSKTIAAMK